MSRMFYIPNSKKVWSTHLPPIMTAGEVLGLVEGLSIYDICFSDEDITKMLHTPLVKLGCVQSGIQGKSGRSIEVGYDAKEKSYTVRVLTPSTRVDWEIAIELIQKLAQCCNSVVVDEEGIRYRSGVITYDYKKDILCGLDSYMSHYGKGLVFSMLCINYPFYFNDDMIRQIHDAPDKIEAFEKTLYTHQYHEAHFCRQKLYQTDNGIEGIYIFSPNLGRCIIPDHPKLEAILFGFSNVHHVDQWSIYGVYFSDTDQKYIEIGKVDYAAFFQSLPKEKYRYIDAKHILLEELTLQELTQIIQSAAAHQAEEQTPTA